MSKLFIPYIMGDLKFIENLKTLSEAGAVSYTHLTLPTNREV